MSDLAIKNTQVAKPKWSLNEMSLLDELYGKKPTIEIARMMNRTKSSVQMKASRLGFEGRYEVDLFQPNRF